ncbi:MAG: DUF6285 domain-containing protein [Actinomycetota bacterium]
MSAVAQTDRPTATELIEAVREFLEREVMTGTSGRLQFHARVAANVLAVVERELAESPLGALTAAARAQETELARRIRIGEFDDRLAEVRDEVRETVRRKLLVADPGHLPPEARA